MTDTDDQKTKPGKMPDIPKFMRRGDYDPEPPSTVLNSRGIAERIDCGRRISPHSGHE